MKHVCIITWDYPWTSLWDFGLPSSFVPQFFIHYWIDKKVVELLRTNPVKKIKTLGDWYPFSSKRTQMNANTPQNHWVHFNSSIISEVSHCIMQIHPEAAPADADDSHCSQRHWKISVSWGWDWHVFPPLCHLISWHERREYVARHPWTMEHLKSIPTYQLNHPPDLQKCTQQST